jgi:hypothetical protein
MAIALALSWVSALFPLDAHPITDAASARAATRIRSRDTQPTGHESDPDDGQQTEDDRPP